MGDGIVKVLSAAAGDKNIDNTELTVGANTVERQRVQISGAGAAELADVRNAVPAAGDLGLVVRPIPSTSAQPISAASLPLPAGASTETTLGGVLKEGTDITGAAMPAGGASGRGWLSAIWKLLAGGLPAALAASGGLKVDIAGTGANATAVKVDGSAVTQPVSGTTTANQGTGAAQANRWPVFLSDGTAERVVALPSGAAGAAALPEMQAFRKATYTVEADAITTGALTAATDKQLLSLEHALASTKTVRIKRIVLNAVITTAGAAAGGIKFRAFTGTAASSAGSAVTPTLNNQRQGAAEVTVKTLPTIVAATGPKCTHGTWAPAAAGPLSESTDIVLYQWVPGETEELTLRAGILEALVIVVQAVSTPTLTVYITVEFTEE